MYKNILRKLFLMIYHPGMMIVIVSLGLLFGCNQKEINPETYPKVENPIKIAKYIAINLLSSHVQWLTLLQYTGLTTNDEKGILDTDKHSLLAPTDKSLSSLPDAIFKVENKALLTRLLQYHIIQSDFSREDLLKQKSLITMDNNTTIIVDNDMLKANHLDQTMQISATITNDEDYNSDNGHIYVIDKILIPEHLQFQIEALNTPTPQ